VAGFLATAVLAFAVRHASAVQPAPEAALSDTAETKPQPSESFRRVVIPTGHRPGSIAVADVNHDGKPDIIVANTEDETVSVLLGDGNGHFALAPGSPFPCGKAPNDI